MHRRILPMAAAMLVCFLGACSRPAPEQALRDAIDGMAAAAEARDAAALVEPLAEDFVGTGGIDRDRFRRTAALVWLREQSIGVTVGPLDIEVTGEHARVKTTVATTGGAGWLPERAEVWNVSTAWRLEDGEWRMVSADWE